MSIASQREFIAVDAFGPDPLLDDSYDAIRAVTGFTTYVVRAQDQFNPALISFESYRTIMWWRAILVYNGIEDVWDLKEGMRIRVPDINEMTTRLQRAKTQLNANTTVTI